jgi:hypothetical protein
VSAGSERRAGAQRQRLAAAKRVAWTAPTRRTFFGLVLATGAAALVGKAVTPAQPDRSTWHGKTRWIGHC